MESRVDDGSSEYYGNVSRNLRRFLAEFVSYRIFLVLGDISPGVLAVYTQFVELRMMLCLSQISLCFAVTFKSSKVSLFEARTGDGVSIVLSLVDYSNLEFLVLDLPFV